MKSWLVPRRSAATLSRSGHVGEKDPSENTDAERSRERPGSLRVFRSHMAASAIRSCPARRGGSAMRGLCCIAGPPYRSELIDGLREREDRVDVDWNILRRGERRFQIGRHLVVLREPCIGSRTVAGGFLLEQFLRKPRGGVANLGVVDAVAS